MKLVDSSIPELLQLYGEILDELKKRGVCRSHNNPVADYSEWLVAGALKLKLQGNSNSGFDAIDSKGIKYEIKSRRLHFAGGSRQLGVIRNLSEKKFNFLIGVLFDKNFNVLEAYKMPHRLIGKAAPFRRHQHGNILILSGKILNERGVVKIDNILRKHLRSQYRRTHQKVS